MGSCFFVVSDNLWQDDGAFFLTHPKSLSLICYAAFGKRDLFTLHFNYTTILLPSFSSREGPRVSQQSKAKLRVLILWRLMFNRSPDLSGHFVVGGHLVPRISEDDEKKIKGRHLRSWPGDLFNSITAVMLHLKCNERKQYLISQPEVYV